jgi:hypothetical protein
MYDKITQDGRPRRARAPSLLLPTFLPKSLSLSPRCIPVCFSSPPCLQELDSMSLLGAMDILCRLAG